MMYGKRRRVSRAQRHALTLASFEATLHDVEAAAALRPDDWTLQGVVILCRAFADRLRGAL